jgi:hypothetical protein
VTRTGRLVFLLLILTQVAHSIEEYSTRLYDVLAPARYVSTFVSNLLSLNSLPLGFAIFNGAFDAFGLWCWAVTLRRNWAAARGLAWFWALVEMGNGIGHVGFAIGQRGYYPGLATAPVLLILAACLAVLLCRYRITSGNSSNPSPPPSS